MCLASLKTRYSFWDLDILGFRYLKCSGDYPNITF